MFCTNCGTKVDGVAKFCPNCGTKMYVAQEKEQEKEQNAEPVIQNEPAEKIVNSDPEPVTEPVNEPVVEPVTEPVKEPAVEPETEPIKESAPEPVEEPIKESAAVVDAVTQTDKTSESQGKIDSAKTKMIAIIALSVAVVFLLIIIIASAVSGKKDKGESAGEALGTTSDSTDPGNGSSQEMSAKLEDGTVVSDFTKYSDKIYVSDHYEKCDIQCPYEELLNVKDFDAFDRIYLIEHIAQEDRVTEDANGKPVAQVDGVTHYVTDTIRLMAEYTSKDGLITTREYYLVCMSNFGQDSFDKWSMLVTEKLAADDELTYSNLNDTYWYIEGDDIWNIAYNEFYFGGVSDEEYFYPEEVKMYLHFYDLDKLTVSEVYDNGKFEIDSSSDNAICDVKVVYRDKSVTKQLMAGEGVGGGYDGFITPMVSNDYGLKMEIKMHLAGEGASLPTAIYTEKNPGDMYKPMTQIDKAEYDNTASVSAGGNSSAANNNSSGMGNASAGGYTDDELCELARIYYYTANGQEPPIVDVDYVDGDMVTIHLYEVLEDHTATWDWYIVDRNTGKGTNLFDEPIDLVETSSKWEEEYFDDGYEEYTPDYYIFEDSDCMYIEDWELDGLSAWDCKVARNEIYARHGRRFKDKELQEYFNGMYWYYPTCDDVPNSELNKYEIKNINTITAYEKAMGYR